MPTIRPERFAKAAEMIAQRITKSIKSRTYMKINYKPNPKPTPKAKKAQQPIKRSPIKKHSETSLTALINAARVVFQKWIRERDSGLPCVSCGKVNYKASANHYLKAELYTGLIFHENNVHGGCSTCNVDKDGNTKEYRKGLIKRIGIEEVEFLESIKDALREYSYTREELNEIIKKYKIK